MRRYFHSAFTDMPRAPYHSMFGIFAIMFAMIANEGRALGEPTIGISDVSMPEGDEGSRAMVFTISLSEASDTSVAVSYQTFDESATAGEDYVEASGRIEFEPGQTAAHVDVEIVGDAVTGEGGEAFIFQLLDPAGGTVRGAFGPVFDQSVRELGPNAIGPMELDGDTLLFGDGLGPSLVLLRRDKGGPNAWEREERIFVSGPGRIDDGILAAGAQSTDAGSCHLYEMQDGDWIRQSTLDGEQDGDRFGSLLAIDGSLLAVGAPGHQGGQGAVYLFERRDDDWLLVQKIADPEPDILTELKALVVREGVLFVVSRDPAEKVDRGYVYERDAAGMNSFFLMKRLNIDGDFYSADVTGDQLVVQSKDRTLSFFRRSDTTWEAAEGIVIPTVVNGTPLDVHFLEDDLLLTAYKTPASVLLFEKEPNNGSWKLADTLPLGERGESDDLVIRSIAGDQNTIAVSFTNRLYPAGEEERLRIFGRGRAVGRVLDDDSPVITLEPYGEMEPTDGSRTSYFVVNLDAPSEDAISVEYAVEEGTARAGEDFVADAGVITFAPGETAVRVPVLLLGDVMFEETETIRIRLVSPSAGKIVGDVKNLVVEDARPEFALYGSALGEGDFGHETARLRAELNISWHEEISIGYTTKTGSAEFSDFVETTGMITFPPGETAQELNIEVKGDELDEEDEVFFIDLEISEKVRQMSQWRFDEPLVGGRTSGEPTFATDGKTLLVPHLDLSTPGNSRIHVWVYEKDEEGRWTKKDEWEDPFGTSSGFGEVLGVSGNTAIVSGETRPDTSRLPYVFQRSEAGDWRFLTRVQPLRTTGGHGNAVAIAGDILAVGAYESDQFVMNGGAVHIYERDAGGPDHWGETNLLFSHGSARMARDFGHSLSLRGDYLLVGDPGRLVPSRPGRPGGATLFRRVARGQWVEVAELLPPSSYENGGFGNEVALGRDHAVLTGSSGSVALIFHRDTGGDDAWGLAKTWEFGNRRVAQPSVEGNQLAFEVRDDAPDSAMPRSVETYTTGDDPGVWERSTSASFPDTAESIGKVLLRDGLLWVATGGVSPNEAFSRHHIHIGDRTRASIHILDDDRSEIYIADARISERDRVNAMSFLVTLSHSSSVPIEVGYETIPVTARADFDFVAQSGVITFAPGQVTQRIDVSINDDGEVESAETFELRLFKKSGGTLVDATAIGTIEDPTFLAAEKMRVTEGHDGVREETLILYLDRPLDQDLAVEFDRIEGQAALGSDFEFGTASPVAIGAGTLSVNLPLGVVGDAQEESTESFLLRLRSPNVNIKGAFGQVAILDDAHDRQSGSSFTLRRLATNGKQILAGRSVDGKVFLYERDGQEEDGWRFVQELVPNDPDRSPSTFFGSTFQFTANHIVIGDPGHSPGAVYLFNSEGERKVVRKLVPSGMSRISDFGRSLACSGDILAVGADEGNPVLLFLRHWGGENAWGQWRTIDSPEPENGLYFGAALALQGDRLLVGSPPLESGARGKVYLFRRGYEESDAWGLVETFEPPSGFDRRVGASVALGEGVLVIGSGEINSDEVWIYENHDETGDDWRLIQSLTIPDAFVRRDPGFGASLVLDGDTLVVTADLSRRQAAGTGFVFIFRRTGPPESPWQFYQAIGPEMVERFGCGVGLAGGTLVVGSLERQSFEPASGYIHVFEDDFAGVEIVDDDDPLTLEIEESLVLVEGDEGMHEGNLQVTLSQMPDVPIAVDYTLMPVTANPETDFDSAGGGTVVSGREGFVTVKVLGDRVPETNDLFKVRLVTSSSGRIVQDTAIVTIANDDIPSDAVPLIGLHSASRYFVTTSRLGVDGWWERSFDDSEWNWGSLGVGFDVGESPALLPLVATDLGEAMLGNLASAYTRTSFDIPEGLDQLGMKMHYNDGFRAYLNGRLQAARNAPEVITGISAAVDAADVDQALSGESVPVTLAAEEMSEAGNVLAIQGLKYGGMDSNFLILPKLFAWKSASGTYTDWIGGFAGVDETNYQPGADFDGDGWPNLVEQALWRDPAVPESDLPLSVSAQGDAVVARLAAAAPVPGLVLRLEASESLEKGQWKTLAERASPEGWLAADGVHVEERGESVLVTMAPDVGRRFLRLAVDLGTE